MGNLDQSNRRGETAEYAGSTCRRGRGRPSHTRCNVKEENRM